MSVQDSFDPSGWHGTDIGTAMFFQGFCQLRKNLIGLPGLRFARKHRWESQSSYPRGPKYLGDSGFLAK
jgi:hypothetical protein